MSKGDMEIHQAQIQKVLNDYLYVRKLNTYHEFVFNELRSSIREFVMYGIITSFVFIFLSIFFKTTFAWVGIGFTAAIGFFLLIDAFFLNTWRRALKVLMKNIQNGKM